MFTNMTHIRKELFSANKLEYELDLYRVNESGELRLFVSKGGEGIGHSFTASSDVVMDAKSHPGTDIAETLFSQAKDDITRNEFSEY